MRWRIMVFVLLVGAGSPGLCFAADPRYPDWPCAQPKVPEISLAAVWAGPPLDDAAEKWKGDAKVSALVPQLAARRTPLEEAEKTITEFLAGSPAEPVWTDTFALGGSGVFTNPANSTNALQFFNIRVP